tara:strand:+ start:170 stop:553 length:384 start_codon:yes stop_codon:yes gene_type:complete
MANNNNNGMALSQMESLIQMSDLQQLLLKAMEQRNLGHNLETKVPHLKYGNTWDYGANVTPFSTSHSNVESRKVSSQGELLDILYQALSGKTGYAQQQVPFRDDAGSLRPGNILDIITQLTDMRKMK